MISHDLSQVQEEPKSQIFEIAQKVAFLLNKKQLMIQHRKELSQVRDHFEQFKDDILNNLNIAMGKITTVLYKVIKEKGKIEQQLEQSKAMQRTMKLQVIQLKQMINDAISGYGKELQNKNIEIEALKEQLKKKLCQSIDMPVSTQNNQKLIKQQPLAFQKAQLEIIQEEASNATFSSYPTSVREYKEEKLSEASSEKGDSDIQITKEIIEFKPQHRKTKSFLDHFRKTIQQSFSEKKSQRAEQKDEIADPKFSNQRLQNHYYSQYLKDCSKEQIPYFKTVVLSNTDQISKSSSNSELMLCEQQKINIPKRFESPKNISFIKRKQNTCIKMMTEPSPEKFQGEKQNYYQIKQPFSQKRIQVMKLSPQARSNSNENKSSKSSVSREKIKVTSKMIDEISHVTSKKASNASKVLVHLGGKSSLRKFFSELKNAFKNYFVSLGRYEDEIKFEGQKRNGVRWGKGRLYYKNGSVYEGEFRENVRHGKGSLILNGIPIYEGYWYLDRIQGEGYIKSMKFLSTNCPNMLNQASYCGNLNDNRMHGIGTVFLNQKQKIVTKFQNGVPIGQLTYYSVHEIQFGVWPND